jgi:hypothetical protein
MSCAHLPARSTPPPSRSSSLKRSILNASPRRLHLVLGVRLHEVFEDLFAARLVDLADLRRREKPRDRFVTGLRRTTLHEADHQRLDVKPA